MRESSGRHGAGSVAPVAKRPAGGGGAAGAANATTVARSSRRRRADQPAAHARRRPAPSSAPGAAGEASSTAGIAVAGHMEPRFEEILSPEALAFLGELHRRFDARRRDLLAARAEQQKRYDAGEAPDFLAETRHIRESDWKVAPIPADLMDRRVEITGPVDRKMIVNALNSGATDYMADFEDANSPTWSNNVEGQLNLKDLWDGQIAFTDPASGKHYAVGNNPAVLIVRPRGWHLLEEHLTVDGVPISGALFDFGLYFFHNAKAQLARGTGPYFYLPKLETHTEARLWNDVFVFAQREFGLPVGTIKATVLIETLPAAFEMDEILWELRDHIAGLNAGRWDYIFSFIKKLRNHPHDVLPDRGQVLMGKAFLGAYAALLVKTCHRRGAFAMGGMAAQIPVKNDPAANEVAFAKVRVDKEREVREGHDGTWVAHPDLVPVAKEVFDRLMPQPNQLDNLRDDVDVTRADLLRIHDGTRTEDGFRLNIRVGVQYIEAWLRGRGAVPIYHLMEDAATAEISRAQIWQWIKYGAEIDGGIKVTPEFFEQALAEEMERVKQEVGADAYANGRFPAAIDLFRKLSLSGDFADFLTIPAYKLIM
jgi:malate synthase